MRAFSGSSLIKRVRFIEHRVQRRGGSSSTEYAANQTSSRSMYYLLTQNVAHVARGHVRVVLLPVDEDGAVPRDHEHGLLHGEQVVLKHGLVLHVLALLGGHRGRAVPAQPLVQTLAVAATALLREGVAHGAHEPGLPGRAAEHGHGVVEPGACVREQDGAVPVGEGVRAAAVVDAVADPVAHCGDQPVHDAVEHHVLRHLDGDVADHGPHVREAVARAGHAPAPVHQEHQHAVRDHGRAVALVEVAARRAHGGRHVRARDRAHVLGGHVQHSPGLRGAREGLLPADVDGRRRCCDHLAGVHHQVGHRVHGHVAHAPDPRSERRPRHAHERRLERDYGEDGGQNLLLVGHDGSARGVDDLH
ncbi:PP222 [Orf virus]|uniref:PP222 n=1 Tax=Orf virus TaxID=10258 RepID=F1AX93_ORFV|nr:PP222 [Orf virus]